MTDTTHEAPERVYKITGDGAVEYVRADLIAAYVAAALREAVEDVRQWGSLFSGSENVTGDVANDILALIPDGGAALDRVLAAERERCAKVAESVALPMDGKIAKAQAGYMRGVIAHHIREGGE